MFHVISQFGSKTQNIGETKKNRKIQNSKHRWNKEEQEEKGNGSRCELGEDHEEEADGSMCELREEYEEEARWLHVWTMSHEKNTKRKQIVVGANHENNTKRRPMITSVKQKKNVKVKAMALSTNRVKTWIGGRWQQVEGLGFRDEPSNPEGLVSGTFTYLNHHPIFFNFVILWCLWTLLFPSRAYPTMPWFLASFVEYDVCCFSLKVELTTWSEVVRFVGLGCYSCFWVSSFHLCLGVLLCCVIVNGASSLN